MATDRLIDVIALATTWADRYPDDSVPLILRGNAQLKLYGKSSNAVKDFERVLRLKPDDPDAHFALALALTNRGDFQGAIPHFQSYLSISRDDPTEALFGLATCQFSLADTDQARASLQQLFAKNKDHPTGCFLQAKVELAEGHEEEALKWLQKADRLSPDEADVTNALVQVCRQLGREQEAARYARRLEEIQQQNDKLDRLLTELKTEPENSDIRYRLGMFCLNRSWDQEASRWFQAILYKDPNHLPTLTTLADYYEKKGKEKLALHYRRKAQKVSGRNLGKSPEPVKK
jgi:tetratricopeptide (TPR) repeat protein